MEWMDVKMEKQSFLKRHGDTLAIIMTTMIICMCIQSIWFIQLETRIEQVNMRIDKVQQTIYEKKKKEGLNG